MPGTTGRIPPPERDTVPDMLLVRSLNWIDRAKVVRCAVLLAALLFVGAAGSFAISAADPFYFGAWNISSATVAPWWTERATPNPGEAKELIGKTIVIGVAGIAGPRQAACGKPEYKVVDSPPEGLFQGMFDEMHQRDKSIDPQKVAASVGFHGTKWKTLETGCANELDYHFIDGNTAAFGLNNYIYLLKKR